MVRFKQLMAFPMLMAAAWLAWVLASLQGSDVVLSALLAAIALAMLLWCYGDMQHGRAGPGSWGMGVLALAVLIWAMSRAADPTRMALDSSATRLTNETSNTLPSQARDSAKAITWQSWAPGRAEQLSAQGQTVFVDFTATWCISCQANKVRVLQSDAIAQAFAASRVTALRADWTRRDPEIAAELARFGRNGVPLYLVYPRSGGPVKVLSEWLTERELLNAIR